MINTVEDAVAVCREAAAKRARESQRSWTQPSWTRWPWLIGLAGVLCAEWALRRRGSTNAAALATAVLIVCANPICAQDAAPTANASNVTALIEQLGAPRVRLRDEAEEKLKSIPEALEAAKAAAKDSANPEVRLRARNVAQTLRQNLWQQEIVAEGHRTQPTSWARNIIVSPDGKHLYTRGEDHVRAWDAQTLQPGITFGTKLGMWRDWQRGGPIWTLAVSPDSNRVVSTNDTGNITVHNAEDGSTLVTFLNRDPSITVAKPVNYRVLWAAAFFPDGKSFATADRGGFLRIWDTESGELKRSITMMENQVSRSVAVSPNGKFIACAIDYGGEPDYVWVWNVENATWAYQQPTTNRMNSLEFSRDNGRLMGSNFDGHIHVWKVGENGALSDERRIGPIKGESARRDWYVQMAKDFFRAVDYLAERPDVDTQHLGYYSLSMGAYFGPIPVALEPRIKAAIFASAGLRFNYAPEIQPANFAPRVKVPVLIVNGKDDFSAPAEARQRLFELLGTPAEHKKLVVLEGGHVPNDFNGLVREALDWLDKYLGPIKP